MMTASPEQLNAVKINTDAFMNLSKIAFSSIERLAALNLSAGRAALEDSIAASNQLLKIKDGKVGQNPQHSTTGTASQKASDYLNNLQVISTETKNEVTKLMASYFAPLAEGSNSSASWLKGYEIFKGYARQVSAMTESSSKAIGDVTSRMTSAASSSKKTA